MARRIVLETVQAKMDFKARIADLNENAVVLDGFDVCIIGTARRESGESVLVYDADSMVSLIMSRDGASREEAQDYFDFNIDSMCGGGNFPVLVDTQV